MMFLPSTFSGGTQKLVRAWKVEGKDITCQSPSISIQTWPCLWCLSHFSPKPYPLLCWYHRRPLVPPLCCHPLCTGCPKTIICMSKFLTKWLGNKRLGSKMHHQPAAPEKEEGETAPEEGRQQTSGKALWV